MCGWQVKLCDPLVTHGPYLSTLEVRHDKALYKSTFTLLYFTLLYTLRVGGKRSRSCSVAVCISCIFTPQDYRHQLSREVLHSTGPRYRTPACCLLCVTLAFYECARTATDRSSFQTAMNIMRHLQMSRNITC